MQSFKYVQHYDCPDPENCVEKEPHRHAGSPQGPPDKIVAQYVYQLASKDS